MSENKHTAEPWEVTINSHGVNVYGSKGWTGGHLFQKCNSNDAKRIVACVNALAGVGDVAKLMFECKQLLELLEDDIVFGGLASDTLALFQATEEGKS